MFRRKKKIEHALQKAKHKDHIVRYFQFLVGILFVAIAFNLFVLPTKIVYGMSGIGVIFHSLWGMDSSLVILIGNLGLLVLSYFLLGKEDTKNTVLGSLCVPLFIKLTAFLPTYITISNNDPLLMTLFGAAVTGFGLGLVFKSGFTTGGTDILNQIVSKYFHMSIGNSMIFTDGLIVLCGVFAFGWIQVMYSLISLYIISIMTDKVILGISNCKTFYIITDHETSVKKFIMHYLSHGVTILDARGGFTGNHQKVIMCIIPTKEYFRVKEGIHEIDPNAFFLVTDAYEVYGGA